VVELLKHLTYVELRWLDWGFEGGAFPTPGRPARRALAGRRRRIARRVKGPLRRR
jgi:hypothetical protein